MSYGFLLEYDWNIYVLEFSDVFQTVRSVSGKSADGLGDNHVDVSGLAVVNHTVKVLTFFCVGAGNTIIGVDNGKFQLCAQPRVCSLTGGNPVYPRPNQPDISESWDGISNGA